MSANIGVNGFGELGAMAAMQTLATMFSSSF
jgi:hypothetical protein